MTQEAKTAETKLYVIKTGGDVWEVEAEDENDAVKKAWQARPPSSGLGRLTEITVKGGDPDEECWYASTVNLLRECGFSVTEESAP